MNNNLNERNRKKGGFYSDAKIANEKIYEQNQYWNSLLFFVSIFTQRNHYYTNTFLFLSVFKFVLCVSISDDIDDNILINIVKWKCDDW